MTTHNSFFKASFFILMFCFAFTMNAQGQYEKTNSKQIAENSSDYVIDELELDDVKSQNLKTINQSYADRMNQLMRSGSGASKDEIEALKRSHSLKVKSILSIEEYEKYLLLKAKMKKDKEAKEKK